MKRAVWVEVALNALAILLLPLVAVLLHPYVSSLARTFGLGTPFDLLAGINESSDIGWEVAVARALVEPGISVYARMGEMGPLIGMEPYDAGVHTHPPTSFVLWLPLTFIPYTWWVGAYSVFSVSAIAGSMRIMRTPAWVAYPLAVLIALTSIGAFGLTTTYPVMALVLALAWRYRSNPWVAGPSYAVLAAGRGLAGLLLAYPLIRRQWKTLTIAVALLLAFLVIAFALEPTVFADFLTVGRESIARYASEPYNYSPESILGRWGLPAWPWWLLALAIAAAALYRRQEPFWVFVWLAFALSPLAWVHSIIQAIPLLVILWASSRTGKMLVTVTAVLTLAVFTPTGYPNLAWTAMVAATGIGLFTCSLKDPEPQRTEA